MSSVSPRSGMGRRLILTLALAGGASAVIVPPAHAGAGHEVAAVTIAQDAEAWTFSLPFDGEWVHGTIANPPRIVLDLIDAQTRLPRAPGLYAVELARGPVGVLRTSQYRDQPGNHIVRFSLVLREPLAYEALRTATGMTLRIARPDSAEWGDPWRVRIAHGDAPLAMLPLPPPPLQRQPAPAEIGAAQDRDPPAGDAPVEAETGPDEGSAQNAVASPVAPPAASDTTLAPAEAEAEAIATLESLLADSTHFAPGRQRLATAVEVAAARSVEEAQDQFLAGDTTAALATLQRSERFYADTDAGRQATLLRHLLATAMGRPVEADLPPAPPREGPWPLVREAVLAQWADAALAAGDLGFAGRVLHVWRAAHPARTAWAAPALRLGEAWCDRSRAAEALPWIEAALAAEPELRLSPPALLLLANARAEAGATAAAESLLHRLESEAPQALAARARALRADIYFGDGRYAAAEELYAGLANDLAVPRVERDWAMYQQANCLVALETLTEAVQQLRRVATQEDNFWAPHARLRLTELAEVHRVAVRD